MDYCGDESAWKTDLLCGGLALAPLLMFWKKMNLASLKKWITVQRAMMSQMLIWRIMQVTMSPAFKKKDFLTLKIQGRICLETYWEHEEDIKRRWLVGHGQGRVFNFTVLLKQMNCSWSSWKTINVSGYSVNWYLYYFKVLLFLRPNIAWLLDLLHGFLCFLSL